MLNSIGRPMLWIPLVLLVVMLLPQSGYADPMFPELIVDAGDVTIHRSHDSVIIFVYVENVTEPIGGIDMWLSLGHNAVVQYMSDSVWWCDTVYYNCQDSTCSEWDPLNPDSCIAWDYFNCDDSLLCSWKQAGATRLEGTAIEDWEVVQAFVHDTQRMMLQLFAIANNGGGTQPIPTGSHLLVKLVCEVASETGSIPDSICDDTLANELFGITPITVEPRSLFSDEEGDDLIGWIWDSICRDSNCIQWEGDSCIEWECIDWDSIHKMDTSKVYFYDGSITLDCSACDWIVGDANGSGAIDIDDVVYLIAYIFQGGPAPVPEPEAGDANCSGAVDIDDVVYLIAYIFQGGPPPPCECQDLL
jgi:hypothetical protein